MRFPSKRLPKTTKQPGEGYGVGGGGGGYTFARPVAAITIGPDGVTVEPIVDATKDRHRIVHDHRRDGAHVCADVEVESEVRQKPYTLLRRK